MVAPFGNPATPGEEPEDLEDMIDQETRTKIAALAPEEVAYWFIQARMADILNLTDILYTAGIIFQLSVVPPPPAPKSSPE